MYDRSDAAMSSGVPVAMILTAAVAAVGPHVDHPICARDHVEVVLDHDDRILLIAKIDERAQEQFDVLEMQPRGGLVQDVQRLAGGAARELTRELHALRFAAGERRRGLTELQIAEAHFAERIQFFVHARDRLEQRNRLFHRQTERIRDRHAAILHFESFAVVALAVARIARDEHVRKKVHLDAKHAVALTRFATTALHVERKTPRLVTARACFRQASVDLAEEREHTRVGCRIRSRRPSDRRLIDRDDLVDLIEPADRIAFADGRGRTVKDASARRAQKRVDR